MLVERLLSKARALDGAAAAAVRDDGGRFYHWLGRSAEEMSRGRFSTLHMCANVWRAAAVMARREVADAQ